MKQIARQYRFGRFWFDAVRGDLLRDGAPLRAGAHALDLLATLLAQPGALVTKDELMRAAWPGLHVEDGNISVQIHNLRNLLEDARKPHRWIVTVPGRGYRFIGRVETSPPPGPAQESAEDPAQPPRSAAGLPAATGPIIGRERELAALQAAMPRHRLVTITGPGGMGKTRLALEFAVEHMADPMNHILFLGLEGLRQRDQIMVRLAARLGLQATDGPQLAHSIADALRRQSYFLILDNCEHVRDEAAALVDIILARAPGVSILATSREPLGVAEEVVFPLGPLEFPAAAAPLAAKAIGTYAAVRLFAETARTGHPSFRLNDETAHTVAAICRKLDGIPLALKLASSGPQALRPAALLEGLSADRRPLLPAPPGMPVRHRTLEAAIAWSVALLSEAERAALRRLGVFAGSFTAADAQTVIAGDPVEPRDVPNLMSSLLKKSLLTPASANNRLRLLESTRHYALDMLANAAEAHQTRRNLARHLVGLFGRGRDVWPDSDAEIWTTAHEPDIDNLRAALDWAFAPGGDAAIGVALAARLRALFSDRLITLREYLAAIFAAIDALTPETPAEDAGWIWFSASHDLSAGMAAPVAHLARAIACFHAAANPAMAGLAGSRAAVLLIMGGDPAPARGYLAEAIATLPCVPDNRYHSAILLNAATALAMQGGDENLAAARDHFANALPLARKFRDHSQIAMLGANIAELDAVLGNYRAAIERCRLLADESRARRDWRRLSFVLSNSMNYHLLADDPLAAGEIGREAIPLLIEIADPHWATDHGGNLALIAAWAGDFRTAAILAGFSAHYYETGAKPRQTIERRIWDRLTAALDEAASAGTLPEPDRLALMDEGAALSFTEAVAIGLKICESLAQHPIKWNHLIG